MAAATRNSGGTVIVQMERVVEHGNLKPHEVVIPGTLIDYVVVADPKNYRQCIADDSTPIMSSLICWAKGRQSFSRNPLSKDRARSFSGWIKSSGSFKE